MNVFTVSVMAVLVAVALLEVAVAIVPEGTNPANDLETFPRLKGSSQGFHDFMRIMGASGGPGRIVARVPAGSDPMKIAAALQQRAQTEEGKVCHIEVLVPQKVSGRCISLEGAPTCMAKDRMETNYKDCLGLAM